MRKRSAWVVFLLGLIFLIAPGCQKLTRDETVSVGSGDVKSLIVDAPRSDMKVTVTASSSASPVDLYVVLDKDREEVTQTLLNGQTPDQAKVLAGKKKVQQATLEAAVPAHSGFAVLIGGATKDTQVNLKIAGG